MPTADGQLFCDEFIGEVIGIDLVRDFRLQLPGEHDRERVVIATVSMGRGPHFDRNAFEGSGRTMGFALAALREQIRNHYGR